MRFMQNANYYNSIKIAVIGGGAAGMMAAVAAAGQGLHVSTCQSTDGILVGSTVVALHGGILPGEGGIAGHGTHTDPRIGAGIGYISGAATFSRAAIRRAGRGWCLMSSSVIR